ncbi:MAG: hypothetical protein HYX75_10475 [Acidobacteria bacterium]|nr:hypothetical protein [Acidobacteriota bacterium]
MGANWPWAVYGHDYGWNAWGHDGLSTGGWTYQTYKNSRGFKHARPCPDNDCGGEHSLCIEADLNGAIDSRSRGEVHISLKEHAPIDSRASCRRIAVPVDMRNGSVSCDVWLPSGSLGDEGARNGVQLFLKSEGKDWPAWYSPWKDIQPGWVAKCRSIRASLSDTPGYVDPSFDPSRVIAVGYKLGVNDYSDAKLRDVIYVDDYTLHTNPPVVFKFEKLEVDEDFDYLARVLSGCQRRVIRVFVFCDGEASPQFGSTGEVTGLDERFFEDFDALISAAQRRNLLLIPVLIDFTWCYRPRMVQGVWLGGHSDLIRNPAKRATYINNALKPLLTRYAHHPQILAWDLINEPEWVMKEVEKDTELMLRIPRRPGFSIEPRESEDRERSGDADRVGIDPVGISEMQAFVRACASAVHRYDAQKVTVGSARRQWLHYWTGQGLDLYQFHWYDHFEPDEPFPWPSCADLALDKPCFVGEVPSAKTRYTVREYLEAASQGGYQGILGWSFRASDDRSDFCAAVPQLKAWCS